MEGKGQRKKKRDFEERLEEYEKGKAIELSEAERIINELPGGGISRREVKFYRSRKSDSRRIFCLSFLPYPLEFGYKILDRNSTCFSFSLFNLLRSGYTTLSLRISGSPTRSNKRDRGVVL